MDEEKIGWKLEDILLHLDLDKKISDEKIKHFLSCLSPENLPSIVEIKRRGKKNYALSIEGEKAELLVDGERRIIHLLTRKVVATTLEKSNAVVNEILDFLSKDVGEKISLGGGIRIGLGTKIKAKNIVSKLIPESYIKEVNSKIKANLKVRGVRCTTGEKIDVIFDMTKKGNLGVMAHKSFKEESKDLLKKGVEDILSYVESLTMKLGEI